MNSFQFCSAGQWERGIRPRLLSLVAVLLFLSSFADRAFAATNILVWDTGKPLNGAFHSDSTASWKRVPGDLLELEANPKKAQSDPGYYGSEYTVKGELAVENKSLAAVFSTVKGRVILHSKLDGADPAPRVIAEVTPYGAADGSGSAKLSRVRLLRNADDEAIIEATFTGKAGSESSAIFSFDKSEIVAVKPSSEIRGARLSGFLAYAIAPSFVADDLVLSPSDYSGDFALSLPSENVLLGLLPGEDCALTMSWPEGKQRLKLVLGADSTGARQFTAIDFENDGRPFFLAASRAPGIWHREPLKPSQLEKEFTSPWRRPFPAKWKTQLQEGTARTTFAFREGPLEIWRGVEGSYPYPVWFDGENARFRFSKKIPPKGVALIYFTEGRETPPGVRTPAEMLKATLGFELADTLLDSAGRALRTHHRRGGDGVHRACTCGCTEAIQAVFEAGTEADRQDYIAGAVDDMIYFIQRHLARIDEYQRFAEDMAALLRSREASNPALKSYLDDLGELAARIPQEYSVQKENMKSLAHAEDLKRQTLALAGRKDPGNRAAYATLLENWRAMGGAQDYVVAQCHVLTRRLYQEAGYGAVTRPEAVELAREIRNRCRQALRNPDGYEIWPDY